MKLETIDDIYAANEAIFTELCVLIDSLTDQELMALREGEKWSIVQIVEHISLVEGGIARICRKLLKEAESQNRSYSGSVELSSDFLSKAAGSAKAKLEAPEIVHPKGDNTIEQILESRAATREVFEEIKPLFEKFDGTEPRFPHPYFGPMSAQEWLFLAGQHAKRHLNQIKGQLSI
jgi:hypothetical protein